MVLCGERAWRAGAELSVDLFGFQSRLCKLIADNRRTTSRLITELLASIEQYLLIVYALCLLLIKLPSC
jgi:hypothetical protein